jgi:hypothetical protein
MTESRPGSSAGSLISFVARFDLGPATGWGGSGQCSARAVEIAGVVGDLAGSSCGDISSPRGDLR